ncbi:TPA: hypothetical protein ACOEAK_003169 [Enterobacter ludwigii]
MMSELSRNNVRLHLSDLPVQFPEKLKSALTRQNAFNEEVEQMLDKSSKALEILAQSQATTQRELNKSRQETRELKQQVQQLQLQLKQLMQNTLQTPEQHIPGG